MSIQHFINSFDEAIADEKLLKVERWMIPNPYFIRGDYTISEAALVVDQLRVDFMPVVDKMNRPIGVLTTKLLLHHFLINKNMDEKVLNQISEQNFSQVRCDDTLLDIHLLSCEHFLVVDEQDKLIGVLEREDLIKGLSKYVRESIESENNTGILRVILESAYEGIAVVDDQGILLEFNEAYSRFTGIKREDAVGRPVTEVIENTKLHITVKTAIPERGVLQNIQGQSMVVHRIPIWNKDRIVGAIGMLIFEGVTELYHMYERLQKNKIREEIREQPFMVKSQQTVKTTLDQIVGVSESTSNVKRLARKTAKSFAPVLITGESGTGKELYAKSIHNLSSFSSGPFISLNCGAIPEHLFESELFGYEEGAFTGAKKNGKPGKFELAQNGTLFLDEIGEMPLTMQIKLLRVLQEKEVVRIGGVKNYEMNVRIIAATNRNLMEMVEMGEFREDLYFRINVIELPIPPLRKRKEDIPPLISHYVKEVCNKFQTPEKMFTSAAVSAFMNYHWRGNVRELVNTIEKLVTLVDGTVIDTHHLPYNMVKETGHISGVSDELNQKSNLLDKAKSLGNEREKELILKALVQTAGNKSKAADQLGIHRTTLYQKLKKFNIRHT
ncbi:sigma-54-dependent Fis family transcriptional regulator [Terrihalobacillus insolitus]|uniref:sigma-54-dependent Fis family transcriptional regulator n=1 Tax=Terrihalobacillus insolitus TaxID=2950438 RepID=UPI002341FF0E|nr:sigma-54-dependent Fis family transcriptional regulator [Terrihalobacillus insolitus]MDC3412875.1 sigma 54-interacting transcriptional regulator [Terrihalobacillus insolitus]